MSKVFCSNCESFHEEFPMPINDFIQYHCLASGNWLHKDGKDDPRKKNAANNCPDYKEKEGGIKE